MGSNQTILTTYYYDNYDFLQLSAYSSIRSTLTYSALSGFGARCTRTESGADISTRGLQTGMAVSLVGMSGQVVSTMYYDNKNRVIQSLSTNHLNGYDKYYYSYKFQGEPEKCRHIHKAYSNAEITENYTYGYDTKGRPTTIQHAVNTLPITKIAVLEYDATGQIKKKKLHNEKQTIDYDYNIHGQVKSISSPHFTQAIRYQDATGQKYYNGNVSEITERTWSDYYADTDLVHSYYYDALNRLDRSQSGLNASQNNIFTTYHGYDKNGNVSMTKRSGYITNGSSTQTAYIDELDYTFKGNLLFRVTDAQNLGYPPIGDADFRQRSGSSGCMYLYDANGNQTGDFNKNISWIKYNHLNLPQKLQVGNGDKTEYVYDASGQKRRITYTVALNPMQIPMGATGTENASTNVRSTTKRDYCTNFVYLNGQLQRIYTPEGYVSAENGGNASFWKRVYHVTDYLGNVRVELNSPELTNTTGGCTPFSHAAYYPFGMEKTFYHYPNSNQRHPVHQFNGNEFEFTNSRYHDFNFRWYDQQLGRFTSQDPLAALDYSVSPYAFCGNNPINRIDPWGLTAIDLPVVTITDTPKEKEEEKEKPQVRPLYYIPSFFQYNDAEFWAAFFADPNVPALQKQRTMMEIMKEQGIDFGDKSNPKERHEFELIEMGIGHLPLPGPGAIKGVASGLKGLSKALKSFFSKFSKAGNEAKGGTKLLNQFNSAESLIQEAGNLTRVKAGLQGFVKGDGPSIFKAITQNGKLQANGQYLLENGMQVGSHFSTTTGAYTIHITPTVGKMIKIRVIP